MACGSQSGSGESLAGNSEVKTFGDWHELPALPEVDIVWSPRCTILRLKSPRLQSRPASTYWWKNPRRAIPELEARYPRQLRGRVRGVQPLVSPPSKGTELFEAGALGELMFIRGRYGHGGRIGYDKEWRAAELSEAGVDRSGSAPY